MHAHTQSHTHRVSHTHTHSHTHKLTHKKKTKDTHAHTHALTHTRMHSRTHTHTHTHTKDKHYQSVFNVTNDKSHCSSTIQSPWTHSMTVSVTPTNRTNLSTTSGWPHPLVMHGSTVTTKVQGTAQTQWYSDSVGHGVLKHLIHWFS